MSGVRIIAAAYIENESIAAISLRWRYQDIHQHGLPCPARPEYGDPERVIDIGIEVERYPLPCIKDSQVFVAQLARGCAAGVRREEECQVRIMIVLQPLPPHVEFAVARQDS